MIFSQAITVGGGLKPAVVHDKTNRLRVIYQDSSGNVRSYSAYPPNGEYGDLTWTSNGIVSPDTPVDKVSFKKINHYGAYGYWSATENDVVEHDFVRYMLDVDVSDLLTNASVAHNVSSAVSSMSGNFINPSGTLLSQRRAALTPGAMIEIYISLGDSDEISLGRYYIDRAAVSYPADQVTVNARNATGKLLKEQYYDEQTEWTEQTLRDNLLAMLEMAGVEEYWVGDASETWRLRYSPETPLLTGIEDIIRQKPGWQIREDDGVIGIGPATDARFVQPQIYEFVRDHNCWEYSIDYDDSDSAARVCVYTTDDPEVRVYADVPPNKWWVQPGHRTLYVQAAGGTQQQQAQAMADEIAESLAISGRLQTFVGLFSPQLTLGDEIRVVDENGRTDTVGTITDLSHNIGQNGFYTTFTVDSGGRKGRTRLSDLINNARGQNSKSSVEIY